MPEATKEFILNYAYNRWQYNQKKNIGIFWKKAMPTYFTGYSRRKEI